MRDVGAKRVDLHELTTGLPARRFGDGETVRFCQREDALAQKVGLDAMAVVIRVHAIGEQGVHGHAPFLCVLDERLLYIQQFRAFLPRDSAGGFAIRRERGVKPIHVLGLVRRLAIHLPQLRRPAQRIGGHEHDAGVLGF